MHVPAFIGELKPSNWIQIAGVITTFGLGVLTFNLTKKIAKRQHGLDTENQKNKKYEARAELFNKFFEFCNEVDYFADNKNLQAVYDIQQAHGEFIPIFRVKRYLLTKSMADNISDYIDQTFIMIDVFKNLDGTKGIQEAERLALQAKLNATIRSLEEKGSALYNEYKKTIVSASDSG